MKITDSDLTALLELLSDLENSEPPSREAVLKKRNARPDYSNMSDEGLAEFFRQNELTRKGTTFSLFQKRLGEEFFRQIKDDLGENVRFVRGILRDQAEYGTWPAPAYAGRIGVILRKAKQRKLSDRFDAAYDKHVIKN